MCVYIIIKAQVPVDRH